MKFVPPHHIQLTQRAEKVHPREISSVKLNKIIEEMLSIANVEQKDKQKPVMVGLAAPQVGIGKRIILVDVQASGKGEVGDVRIYLNPEVVFTSSETNEWYEGCYSTSYVCGIVSRPSSIKLKALNREGKAIEEEHTGYIARIFQHEIDHLDGKVFVDRITSDEDLHKVEKEEFPLYRNDEGWRNWPNKVTRKEWQRIKGLNTPEM